MSISANIKELRRRYKLSQKELGDIAGVSDKAVSTWEKGIKEPRMGAIQKMADYFNLKKSNIIEEDGLNQDLPDNMMVLLTPAEQRHLDKYRQLSTASKHTIDDQIDYLLYKEEQDEELQAKKDSQCSA